LHSVYNSRQQKIIAISFRIIGPDSHKKTCTKDRFPYGLLQHIIQGNDDRSGRQTHEIFPDGAKQGGHSLLGRNMRVRRTQRSINTLFSIQHIDKFMNYKYSQNYSTSTVSICINVKIRAALHLYAG